MVSLVIVSHSRQLAQGVVELAQQMTQGQVALAAAGGIDDPENPIGTDAMAIQAAIEAVYSEDGVVVLMDLGSAILSAELALEFLEPDQAARVHLCAAPLVEGAVAAAVQAAAGSPATAVMQEAMTALQPKQSQLGVSAVAAGAQADDKQPAAVGQPAILTLTIQNKMGLHARPAARFVSTAVQFQADITVQKGEQRANAKSMNQVATLGVRQGETITVTAVGADGEAALVALQTLADENFGDKDEPSPPAAADTPAAPDGETGMMGIAASPGVAVAPAWHYRPALPEIAVVQVADAQAEINRLQTAVAAAVEEIGDLIALTERQLGRDDAAIFQAHQLILQDPELQQDARRRLTEQQINAEAGWQETIESLAIRYEAIDDPYMRARAADVRDVGQRVLRRLLGEQRPSFNLAAPVILLAEDLTPSDTVQLDPEKIVGILTERGGATSHSAILARGLNIPAVVGVGHTLKMISDGVTVAIDGRSGQIWPDPDADTLAELKLKREAWLENQQSARQAAQQPAVTGDGRRLEIAANIGSVREAAAALPFGAEGVGLFRTEFLFLDRDTAPTEDEQLAVYRQAAEVMGARPLIIRTLDVGGDKPLPYLDLGVEENPFLGWRGIRFCLDTPDIFKPQLRAILRASPGANIKLMFPMIGTVAEIRAARAVLAEVQDELHQAKVPFASDMEVGMMIEVPAAVAVADQLAREVDFFSIGTNDLTQYVMAADRGNRQVAALANALQPALLRLIAQTVTAAHEHGIWVGMCGELAGKAEAAPLLVGLGLDELSMAAPAIPAVKEAIRHITLPEAEELAKHILTLETSTAVEDALADRFSQGSM